MARCQTAADQMVERLIEWGIDTVFGGPNGPSLARPEALYAGSPR